MFLKIFKYYFFVLIISFSSNVFADSSNAKKFVDNLSDRAITTITDKSKSSDEKEEELKTLFNDSVDFEWMGKFVMGRYWRVADEDQKQEYNKYYKKFLVSSYIPRFKEYTNEKIVIKDIKSLEEGEYLVDTSIKSSGSAPIIVSYKLRKNDSGDYLIFDVIAEGISLITTQRSDFSGILSRGGIKSLIKKLKAKSKS